MRNKQFEKTKQYMDGDLRKAARPRLRDISLSPYYYYYYY